MWLSDFEAHDAAAPIWPQNKTTVMESDDYVQMSTAGGSGAPSDRMAARQNKQLIVKVGTVTMVLLIIIDATLLYLWLTSKPTKFHKTVTKTVDSARRLFVPGLYLEDAEDSYLLLEEISPYDLSLRDLRYRQRLCKTTGCLWIRDYLRSGASRSSRAQSQRRSQPLPCDDFHEHVCGSRQQSIYEDGVARLMDAVRARLLGAHNGTAGNGSEVAKDASKRKRVKRHARLLQRCLDGATIITEDDVTSYLPHKFPMKFVAIFLARPLVEQAYHRLHHQPQVQACLRFVEDVSRKRTTDAARTALSNAVDSLDDTMVHFVWEAGQARLSLSESNSVRPNLEFST
ncbi:hypothetical protein HPB50_027173 [Hyalomma asiaticum]|uniref:Uncharacterized protein n=1 Tax=Hyalomma asiaticum TaxID=266040 RepID=A0ACB7RQR6_HYAAI|nr:hypothetical protein HPB50_027173 [Hyalomma asiaticum]